MTTEAASLLRLAQVTRDIEEAERMLGKLLEEGRRDVPGQAGRPYEAPENGEGGPASAAGLFSPR